MNWQILGFENEKKFFQRLIKNQSLAHAYCFYGQEMIGKKSLAKEIAAAVASPTDIRVIDAGDIESVREAKKFLSLTAFVGDKKVVIIDNADSLQVEAQNALLKILEEPGDHSLIFLIARQPQALLPTIVSRCQLIFLPPHPRAVFDQYFKTTNFSVAQQDFLYNFSNGSLGMVMTDQGQQIKKYIADLSTILKSDVSQRFQRAQELSQDEEILKKVYYWMLYLRLNHKYDKLAALSGLYADLSRPQFSRQLALENFMLEL